MNDMCTYIYIYAHIQIHIIYISYQFSLSTHFILFSSSQNCIVCWDNFDANEIWSSQITREKTGGATAGAGATGTDRSSRKTTTTTASASTGIPTLDKVHEQQQQQHHHHMDRHERRRGAETTNMNNNGGGGGAWRRGVALPPTDARSKSTSYNYREDDYADNPNDLWDDPDTVPGSGAGGISTKKELPAATDFSAFGGSLDDDPIPVSASGGGIGAGASGSSSNAFDLGNMSDAARQFELELHGEQGDTEKNGGNNSSGNKNTTRPLTQKGTTIQSGSGDDVNVFEDFGAPDSNNNSSNTTTSAAEQSNNTSAGGQEQSKSSRLMQMIGVTEKDNDTLQEQKEEQSHESKESLVSTSEAGGATGPTSLFSFSTGLSKNPWGEPLSTTTNDNSNTTATSANATTQQDPSSTSSFGVDLAVKLQESSATSTKDQSHDSERLRLEEMERIRLMDEEKRRVSLMTQQQQQQQAELRLRQQQQQQQQGPGQVESILTERISKILENSWGRSDLMSILSTLHSEDNRVAALLGTVDALRALIARHPRRFALAKDPAFGSEMAVLLMDNNAWKQHQQAEEIQRRRQEEEQQLQKIIAGKEAAARLEAEKRKSAAASAAEVIRITDAPWFYLDPQGNVQVRICEKTVL
jgi:hypothetical protein